MAVITLRVEDDVKEGLEEVAATVGVSVSELVRKQVDLLLGRTDHPDYRSGENAAPATLRPVDRKVLSMLHQVLDKLGDDDVEEGYHRICAEVLQRGFVGEYSDEFADISSEMSHQDCELVWDILDLFRVTGASIRSLEPDAREALGDEAIRQLTFSGLDANDSHELDLLIYARFLIEQGRWQELAHHFTPENGRGNSHARMLPKYQRMLAIYTPLLKKKVRSMDMRLRFTADELRRIAQA